MSNMSYCRFQNTAQDLRDCLNALEEMRDDPTPDGQLSSRETDAAKSLLETCAEMVALGAEKLDKGYEEVVESSGYMGEVVDSLNTDCVEAYSDVEDEEATADEEDDAEDDTDHWEP